MRFFLSYFLWFFAVIGMGQAPVWAVPEIAFSPSAVALGSIAVGSQDSTVLTIKNVGDETLVVTGAQLARGSESAFEVAVTGFQLVAGDSAQVRIRFKPTVGGSLADVLTLQTNLPLNTQAPRPVVQLTGEGFGAELDVSSAVLSFASQGIGAAATQNLLVTNRGNDTLRISNTFVKDVRFAIDATAFNLAPGVERIVRITYTPDSSRARVDTLHMVSNDFDEAILKVVLDAQETPQKVGTARISLSRSGAAFPHVGDTLSVSFTLVPTGASVAGVELFFGYNPTLFALADTRAPYLKTGYSASRLKILSNKVVSTSANFAVIHLSGLASAADSITAEGVLTQVNLVVRSPLTQTTRLRVLVEAPLFNSQFITPAGLSFTMPSSNSLGLGNTPPVIHPFPPLTMSEDKSASLALLSLATDVESAQSELQWSFQDPDSLISVSISTPDPAVGPIARFFPPPNLSGTFAVMAKVSDPAGASDSSVVVVGVSPVNDPPSVPAIRAPGDQATGVRAPVSLQWSAHDPDRDDALRYDVHFGRNSLFLDEVATNLSDSSLVIDASLIANTVYFWQAIVRDEAGAEVSGPIWQFTTETDLIGPVFLGGPEISDVTDSTAVVFWSLDEPALARIVLGLQADLSDSLDFEPVVINEQVRLRTEVLNGLTPGTQYYFRLLLTDAAGNTTAGDILTLTTTGQVPLPNDVGDFTGDRLVNFDDFIIFAAVFNKTINDIEYVITADFDNSGVINFRDFIRFAGVYNTNYAVGN